MKNSNNLYKKMDIDDEKSFKEFKKDVGMRIRALREQKGWSQEKLAQEIHINDKYVYEIEVGNKNVSSWVIKKLTYAFEVDANLFIHGESINSQNN